MANPAPPGRARPSSVTISSYLLFFVAALQLISTVLGLAYVGKIRNALTDVFQGVQEADSIVGFFVAFIIAASVVGLVIALVLALLAVFNNRGKNGSRITTWVIGGLFLCCNGLLVASQAGGSMNFGGGNSTDPNMPTNTEIETAMNGALPSWAQPVTTTLSVIGLLALLAALILLALPPSNEFFRKRPADWQPPAGGGQPGQGGYTAYPAYPAAAGYQQPTHQPGTDPTPGTPGTGGDQPWTGPSPSPTDPPRGDSGYGPTGDPGSGGSTG
ncbi:MAG TPA: hypothetical protein VES42_17295 [Pilimelia sp.]|nr:hypothetical protein [Pilimelia sp.]